jgi:hypothetical protein
MGEIIDFFKRIYHLALFLLFLFFPLFILLLLGFSIYKRRLLDGQKNFLAKYERQFWTDEIIHIGTWFYLCLFLYPQLFQDFIPLDKRDDWMLRWHCFTALPGIAYYALFDRANLVLSNMDDMMCATVYIELAIIAFYMFKTFFLEFNGTCDSEGYWSASSRINQKQKKYLAKKNEPYHLLKEELKRHDLLNPKLEESYFQSLSKKEQKKVYQGWLIRREKIVEKMNQCQIFNYQD